MDDATASALLAQALSSTEGLERETSRWCPPDGDTSEALDARLDAQRRLVTRPGAEAVEPLRGIPGAALGDAPAGPQASAAPPLGGRASPGGGQAARGDLLEDLDCSSHPPARGSRKEPKVRFRDDGDAQRKTERQDARQRRTWWLLANLRPVQPYAALRKCMRVRVTRDEGVSCHVHEHDGVRRGRLGGLARCNSAWACSACFVRIRSKYAKRVAKALAFFGRGRTRLVTHTVRHRRGQPLKVILAGVREALRKFVAGRWWQNLRKDLGLHYAIALEITHGVNGWHVHVHALWFMERPELLDVQLSLALQLRWQRSVARAMGQEHEPDVARGLQVDECPPGAAFYLLGLEATDAMGAKRGRGNHRSVWQIAVAYCAGRRKRDRALWVEYVEATRRRNCLRLSAGLWKHIGIVSDEDLEADDGPTDDTRVGTLGDELWAAVRDNGARPPAIMRALAAGGMPATERLFSSWGFKVAIAELGHAGPPVLHLRR